MTAANKQAPRPAATILLLREQTAAPEVFMLQRTSKAAFLPGAFVFPGGALDPDEDDPVYDQAVAMLDEMMNLPEVKEIEDWEKMKRISDAMKYPMKL